MLDQFTAILDKLVEEGKTDGTFDEGVGALQVASIEAEVRLRTDTHTGATTVALTCRTPDHERLVVIVGPVLPIRRSLANAWGEGFEFRVVRVTTDGAQRIAGIRFSLTG